MVLSCLDPACPVQSLPCRSDRVPSDRVDTEPSSCRRFDRVSIKLHCSAGDMIQRIHPPPQVIGINRTSRLTGQSLGCHRNHRPTRGVP